MKVPQDIKDVIKKIEDLGLDLAKYEKILYDWLDMNNIDYEDDVYLDTDLNILFQNHNGDELLKSLKKIK